MNFRVFKNRLNRGFSKLEVLPSLPDDIGFVRVLKRAGGQVVDMYSLREGASQPDVAGSPSKSISLNTIDRVFSGRAIIDGKEMNIGDDIWETLIFHNFMENSEAVVLSNKTSKPLHVRLIFEEHEWTFTNTILAGEGIVYPDKREIHFTLEPV